MVHLTFLLPLTRTFPHEVVDQAPFCGSFLREGEREGGFSCACRLQANVSEADIF
jgi:hypothetical protein